MLELARARIDKSPFKNNVETCHGSFEEPCCSAKTFDIILLDLGISSLHLDTLGRGMSYREESLLDLRMDQESGEPAWQWMEQVSERDLAGILFKYGEERFAPAISRRLKARLTEKGNLYTSDVVEICDSAYPPKLKYDKKKHTSRHTSVKTLQALRIYTNRELEKLEKALANLPQKLNPGGRMIIISFHSLEDRMVKQSFLSLSRSLDEDPHAKSFYKEGDYRILTPKPLMAGEEELSQNPRARSARMRVLEKK